MLSFVLYLESSERGFRLIILADTEVLARAELPSIHTILMQHQLRWAGHLVRMSDHHIPKRLFYGELEEGNAQ